MKILVIATGGTIGSAAADNGVITLSDNSILSDIKNNPDKYGCENIKLAWVSPYTILSERLSGAYINALVECVLENIGYYDGIIITHGTDTLQYSAAAVSYAVGSRSSPVVFAASDFPVGDPRANGGVNFTFAAKFIEGGYGRGDFVSNKNENGKMCVHRASRLMEHAPFSNDLNSYPECYGVFERGKFIYNPAYVAVNDEDVPFYSLKLSPVSPILRLKALPGMLLPRLDMSVRAVMIETYHSGTLPADTDEFRDFCRTAQDYSIPVYTLGVNCRYETAGIFDEFELKRLPRVSPPAMYIKLWALGARAEKTLWKSIGEDIT